MNTWLIVRFVIRLRIAALITAIGVSFLLEYGMVFFVGANTRSFPQVIKTVRYNFGPISISNIQLMILGVSVFLMVALQFIIKKTKMGKAMRAVSVDSDAAQLMGINVNRTISFHLCFGFSLGRCWWGLDRFVLQLDRAFDGDDTRIKAFVAAVLGGIGIIPGAALGGLSSVCWKHSLQRSVFQTFVMPLCMPS